MVYLSLSGTCQTLSLKPSRRREESSVFLCSQKKASSQTTRYLECFKEVWNFEFCLWWQFPNGIPCHSDARGWFFALEADSNTVCHSVLGPVFSTRPPAASIRCFSRGSLGLWSCASWAEPSNACHEEDKNTFINSIRNITEHPRTWIEALNAVFQIRSECLEDKRLVEKYPASQQVSASTPPHSMQLPRRHCTARPDWHGSLTGHGAAFVITMQFKTGLHPNRSITTTTTITEDQGPRTRTRKVR